MPPVVIGPTVSIIGLSLAANAISDLQTVNVEGGATNLAVLCGIITLIITTICSTYGKKMARLIPFIIGILCGYAVAGILTGIGYAAGIDALKITNFAPISGLVADGVNVSTFFAVPSFTFFHARVVLRK